MSEVTLTLEPRIAESIRTEIVGWDYGAAAEAFENRVTGEPVENLDRIVAAKEKLARVEGLVDQLGWETPIRKPKVTLAADAGYLRQTVARRIEAVCDDAQGAAKRLDTGHGLDELKAAVAEVLDLVAVLEQLEANR